MGFDLGALVTRMVVEGRGAFERELDAGGAALARTAGRADALGLSLGTMGTRTDRLGQAAFLVGNEFAGLGERGRVALQQIGTGATVAGLAVSALLGLAIYKYAEYDAAISRSVAVTGAYGNELVRIRELTIDLGGSTVFTAKEAAEGVTELGKAGVATADILSGGLAGSLNLAAAGELQVAEAATYTASTLNQFSLEGRDATHVSDLLAAGAGKAQGSVQDMGAALNQAGLVANQAGLSVEETTGTLAAFASAGLIGSDAGTSFRTMLLNLMTPTKQQTMLLEQYNIEAYDTQGNFVGITSLAGQLQTGLSGVTQAERDMALGIIFGSDAIRAANVLMTQGETGIRKWISAVDDSGYAARVAGINQDNLRGDIEKLGGAFDSALIQTGEGANGVLREMVQQVTALVDGFGELPDWMQQIVLGGLALTAGFLLVGGAMSIGIARSIELRANLAALAAQMPLTAAAAGRMAAFMAGPWGIAIALAVAGASLLTTWIDSLKASSDELQGSIRSSGGSLEVLWATAAKGRGLVDLGNNMENIAIIAERLKAGSNPFSFFFDNTGMHQSLATLSALGKEMAGLADQDLPAVQTAFRSLATETDGSNQQLNGLLNAMPELRQKLIDVATANGDYNETMTETQKQSVLVRYAMGDQRDQTLAAADAYKEAADEAEQLADQVSDLIELINESNGIGQDAVSANAQWQESLAGLTDQVKQLRDEYIEANGSADGFTLSLDENTASGSANAEMLAQAARDAQDAAAAQYEVDQRTMGAKEATDKYLGTLAASREALIAQAIANGFTAEEVQNLMDRIYAVPTQHETEMLVATAEAIGKVDSFIRGFDGRRIRVYVDAVSGNKVYNNGTGVGMGWQAYGGIVRAMAQGGSLVPSNAGAVAQIKRAGDVTVWAEHETAGEAYIPFALDRRARSEAILGHVAGIFGGMYVPAGARRMASGGVMDDGNQGGLGASKVINVGGIHMHHAVTRDPIDDMREGAQLVGALLGMGG